MLGVLKKLFKSKSEKDVKALQPYVEAVHEAHEAILPLTDAQLRDKTAAFKATIQEATAAIQEQMDALHKQIDEKRAAGAVHELEPLFEQIDKLKTQRNEQLEQTLMTILPEAFAVVKETARRFAENGQLTVPATDWDRQLAESKNNVEIKGESAIWHNKWDVMGDELVWNMIHYDVQLMGGVTLHQGKIAEMATGEGKTLVSTLPSYLNALAGYGVHVVTVNNYLAERDAQWNAPLFEFHGLSVACIDLHRPNSDERREAYRADIIYGTNNEFGFDYLRDNMATAPEHLVQREHHFAMIDEVDSVLIDEARTPLIISGPVPQGDKHEFHALKPRIERLVNLQRKLVTDKLNEARKLLKEGKDKEAGERLFTAYRGLPKYKPLIKMLSEEGMKVLLQKTESTYLADNARRLPEIDELLYFTIDEKQNQVEMTDNGREAITQQGEEVNLFVLPDISEELFKIDQDEALSKEERAKAKDTISREFSEKTERLHAINQLLKAYALFELDVDYIVAEGKVQIVDENTGRVLAGRRYSDGLHQAIEAKENVKVEAATQTFATVTLQNYFRMYHKLSGMTGTAETEAAEFFDIYKLDVVVVPTNKPIIRDDQDDKVYKTQRAKFNAIIDEIEELREEGRPVLVGTSSVETSEKLSRMLKMRKVNHNVLNAKQHAKEAEIVAEAGKTGAVTIATNMAGRGTDIKLKPEVIEAGGLAIIGSERHDSRRIDRQLRGRAGRQGDPGSSQFFVSLEDDLMRKFNSQRIAKVMDFLKIPEDEVIQDKMITRAISNNQRRVEENNFSIRKRLLEYDDVMNGQREAIYSRRRNALFGDRIQVDLDNMLYDFCTQLASRYVPVGDAEGLQLEMLRILGVDPGLTDRDLDKLGATDAADKLYELAMDSYRLRDNRLAEQMLAAAKDIRVKLPNVLYLEVLLGEGSRRVRLFAEIAKLIDSNGHEIVRLLEKTVMLGVIDERWKEHLRDMDELKQNVQMAQYEQKDPLLIYKMQAYELFDTMLERLNHEALSMLFKADIAGQEERNTKQTAQRQDFSRLKTEHGEGENRNRSVAPVGAPGQERKLSRRERRQMERNKKR